MAICPQTQNKGPVYFANPSTLTIFRVMKHFLYLGLGFGLLLLVIFSTFLFDSQLLMLNQDQLGGLGARYLRVPDLIMSGWDDMRLGGVPTLDALFGDIYHPLVLTQWLFDPARAVGFKFILCVWIAFFTAYALAHKLTGRWEWAGVLGFLYAFNPQFFTHILGGHDGKMMVMAMAPLATLGLIQIIREGRWLGFFTFTFTTTWMVLSSHLQLTYFFLWGAGFFTLFEAFRTPLPQSQRMRRIAVAAAALALGLGLSIFQLIPPYEYTTQQSVRGTGHRVSIGHATSWSLHPEEMVSMLVPGFILPNVHDQGDICPTQSQGRCQCYWGHNVFKLNQDTAGTMLTFLAFLSFFLPKSRRQSLFWFAGASIILSYSLGANSPLFDVWFQILPGVKNFRAPAMAILWIPLAMLIMATPVLSALQNKEERRHLFPGVILFVCFIGVATLARFSWESVLGVPGAGVVLGFAALILAVWNLQDRQQPLSIQSLGQALAQGLPGTSRLEMAALLVPSLIISSFFLFYTRVTSGAEFMQYFQPLNTAIMQSTASSILPYSLFAIAGALIFYFAATTLKSTHFALMVAVVAALELWAIDLPYIQEIPRTQYVNPAHPIIKAILSDSPDPLHRPRVFSVSQNPAISGNIFWAYGIRHAGGSHDNELASSRAFREQLFQIRSLNELAQNPYIYLYNIGYFIWDTPQGAQILRTSASGEAKLYTQFQVVPTDSIIPLLARGYDFQNSALLSEVPQGLTSHQPDSASPAKVQLIASPQHDRQTFQVESSQPSLLVVSGNYHPYWKVQIDGNESSVIRAFSTLRAVVVPAGNHTVEMYYQSDSVTRSMRIVFVSLGILLIMVFLFATRLRKQSI